MDEKRFMKSMARQDQEEQVELERSELAEKDRKKKQALILKKKAQLTKALHELEDPTAVDRLQEQEIQKVEQRKQLAITKAADKKK